MPTYIIARVRQLYSGADITTTSDRSVVGSLNQGHWSAVRRCSLRT